MRSDIAPTRAQHSEPASPLDHDEVQLEAVALLRWPENHAERASLKRAQRPRLLLVGQGAAPPPACDDLEDWTRAEPGSPEAQARMATLSRRSQSLNRDIRLLGPHLHRGSRQIALNTRQCVVIAPLIRLSGRPVPRAVVAEALTLSGTTPSPSAVRSLLVRLDRAVAPLGLRVWLLSGDAVMFEVLPDSV
jgi:hypothetical protein